MKRSKKRSAWSSLWAGTLLCAFASTVQAHDTYRITSIGPGPADPDYQIIYANGMNDRGEVVGAVYGANYGWVWRNGQFTNLPALPDAATQYSEPFAINDKSVIAGVSANGENQQRPVLWKNGDIRELSVFPDENIVTLYDINNRGVIAGDLFSDTFGISGAMVIFGNHARELPALPGGNGFTTVGHINEFGFISGTSSSANGLRGVIWTLTGTVHDLGSLPGVSSVAAGDLNDLGTVTLGLRYGNDTQGFYYRAAVWQFGHITELPILYTGDFVDTSVSGINNRGQLCGGTNITRITSPGTAESFQYAVLWEDGVAYDVNNFIAADDPLKPYVTLVGCQEINERGQILAQGRDSRSPNQLPIYLLTPVRAH